MIVALNVALAAALGILRPLGKGIVGFLASAAVLFFLQFLARTGSGFEGLPLSESIALFEDSWVAYFGFNAQVTYRAFALPLLVLAIFTIIAMGSGSSQPADQHAEE